MQSASQNVVMITGASGNLGQAAARAFQQAGFLISLADRSPDRIQAAFADCAASPGCLLAGGVDLTSPDSASRWVSRTVSRFGRIDVLVNTVGAWRGGRPVHETDLADWDFLFQANVRTTLLACRAVIPFMIGQKGGRIVNVASRDALAGGAGFAAYSASKSAVVRLTESLAAELKEHRINVNCLLPGTIDTPQNRAAMPGADFSRWVGAGALAEVILFLASDAARAVTGAALPAFGWS